mgnify:CR=1 FL=1
MRCYLCCYQASLRSRVKGYCNLLNPILKQWCKESGPTGMAYRYRKDCYITRQGVPIFFPGNSLLAKAEWLGECTLIKLRAKSPIDGLSEREKTVEKCLLMGKPTKRSPEGYAVFLPLPAIIFSQSIWNWALNTKQNSSVCSARLNLHHCAY